SVPAHRAERHQEQGRLPDARLPADEDEARGDEASAEDAVELRHAGRYPLGVLRLDLDQAEERTRCRGGRAARLWAADGLRVQARLPRARPPANEAEARGDEASAEDAVELRHAGRYPLGVLRLDLDQAEERTRCRGGRAARLWAADGLLVQAPERAATGAAPEPARGLVPALGAGVDDRDLGHAASLRSPPDGFCAESVTKKP